MSITTSREDREEAAAKIAEKSDEQLQADLSYWAVVTADHQHEWLELTTKRQSVQELHDESQAWVGLIVEELRKRRGRPVH